MRVRAIDTNGDWLFGAGLSSYYLDNDAIMANIEMKLKTFFSECFFDQSVGVPWFDLIPQRNKDIIVLTIKSHIYNCQGVLRVNEVSYDFTTDRILTIKYDIQTLFETHVSGVVTL